MYEEFYGLTADPFRLTADHRFCFDHRSYARAKAYVRYALYRAEGFVMVTGKPGTGKTTLINDLLASLPDKEFVAGTLVSTQLGAEDLLLMTGYAFGLDFHTTQKALVLQRLMEFLNQQHRQGLRTLLIIDEAQDLSASALEELRLLTNLQRNSEPLLQIALLGQEALRELVRGPAMEQVQQRLIAAWQLDPLDPEETIGYVRHRLQRAGWQGDPTFEPGVLRIVHGFSQGIPRRVNLICSRLMLHGFISERHSLTVDDAVTVARDLHREELARPDYKPEEALAHTMEAGNQDMGDGAAAERASGDSLWSGIDHGLFWTAARKDPEPDTGKVEPQVPERTEPDETQAEPWISEARESAEAGPQTPGSANREPDAAASKEPPAGPLRAAAAAPGSAHELEPEFAPLKRSNAHSAGSSPLTARAAGPDAPAAAEPPDSVTHIVPDKAEHWEQTVALASGSTRRAAGKRRSGVLWWFLLIIVVSVALIAALLLARTDAMRNSPVTGISPAVAALEQWWSESSATALDALESLRAEIAQIAAREGPDTDAAGGYSSPLETEAGPESGQAGDGASPGSVAALEHSPGNGAAAVAATEAGTEVRSRAGTATRAATFGAGTAAEVPSTTALTSPSPKVSTEPVATETMPLPAGIAPGSPVEAPPLTGRPREGAAEVEPLEAAAIHNAPLTTAIGGSAQEARPAPAAAPAGGRVFFRVNSTTVDPQFLALMSEIAEAIVKSDDAYAEIVGYTDTTGTTEYNRYLSNRRAEAVAEQLRERGVPQNRLRIEGQGPRESESGVEGFRAEDRVVEITVRYGPEG